jgi:hypothetical protein
MRIKVGDRVYDKVSQRYGIVKKFVGEDFVGMFYVKADCSEESEWRFPEDIELADSSEKDSRDSNSVKIICCKDCELWNTWGKKGESCSCAHFTLDNSNAVYTKPEDFCSYAEKR